VAGKKKQKATTSLTGNTKQKASQALRGAQRKSRYVPLKRTRKNDLNVMEVSKLEAALSNDASYGWTLTSNLRITQKHDSFKIVLNWRERESSPNGKPILSTGYSDQNSAKKAAFEFRYSWEACTGKRKVDRYLDLSQRLLNGGLSVCPTEVLSGNMSNKKDMAVNCSDARKKSVEMTVAIKFLNASNIVSRNPSNPSNNMSIKEFLDKEAKTIQKCLKGRALTWAAKAMPQIATYQKYRKVLMLYLRKPLAIRDGLSLLVGAEDPEIAATIRRATNFLC
jgi:hypothetical protein